MNNLPETISSELPKRQCKSPLWRTLSALSQKEARALLPEALAIKYTLLPLSVVQSKLGDPILSVISASEEFPQEELRFVTGSRIVNEVAPVEVVNRAIVAAYLEEENIDQNKPEEFFKFIIRSAVSKDSSDIHIEPVTDISFRVRCRIDGLLREVTNNLSADNAKKLTRYLKARSNLDMTIHDLPQESAFSETIGNLRLRLRLSVLPTGMGDSVVIRIHELGETGTFQELGLDSRQISLLEHSLASNSGMVLVSGPTGSGKSTLMYACLEHLSRKGKKVITIEDPIERTVSNVTQIEVNKSGQRAYLDYLPAVLRQDPEVLMIGEIREPKTAKLAFEASLTGHLVLSSLHGGSIREILGRLTSLGLEREECLPSFRLVVTQRLVGRNCPHCKTIDQRVTSIKKFFSLSDKEVFYYSKGCSFCGHAGINGRIGVYEMKYFSNSSPNKSYYPIYLSLRKLLLAGDISADTAMKSLGLELSI